MGNCLRKLKVEQLNQEITNAAAPPTQPLPSELKGRERVNRCQPGPWDSVLTSKKEEMFHAYRLHCFCYSVLKEATHKFSSKNLVGEGGFGDVYKGWINPCTMTATKENNGSIVAVKRLRRTGAQGHKEWLNELRFLSEFNHPNIVKLIGYCCEDQQRILVYEYMLRGSLEELLFGENNQELSWSRRIRIALGAARGLEYLHEHAEPVIHRDIKASNILLDGDFTAKLSDFGLARLGPQDDRSYVSTRVLGTKGYFAPEYIGTGHLTLQTDTYSFGIVLLEIFSGSSAITKYSDGNGVNLAQWARPYLSSKLELHHIMDRRLGMKFPLEKAHNFTKITLRCLHMNPKNRPTMAEVVTDLEQLL
ncbi:receptor-like cytoplasmic kinase 176 [Punica granatum]|uniref:Receptor-like cytoplasmic kinase 176 n=2 Tax=Punica granatum TaxID=22663 RepID=A0A6P8EBN2_PUNGR|nr:receptor-like cytoplasmic kinase 176 [Punica granatum]PKI36855.1 hypothetical protein CRG98_042804 [Punica granatum]